MFDKLLSLFKDSYSDDENYIPPSIAKRDARRQELASQPVQLPLDKFEPGRGTLIGFNYLKGLNDEDDINQPRKFFNLSKLLRGDYKDGKIEATPRGTEDNIRGENSKRHL